MPFTKTHKRLTRLFFGVAALILLCANSLLLWVVTGPRSLNAITPYIESALAPAGSPYQVKVGSSELVWDGWEHPVAVHVKNVTVLNDKGAVVAHFPEIGVHMYFFKLLVGKFDLKRLEVLHPTALLIQGDDGSLSFGLNSADAAADANVDATANNSLAGALALLIADEGSNPVTHLKSLVIEHATISIKKSHSGVFLQSTDAALEITRGNGSAKGLLTMPLAFNNKNGELDAELTLSKKAGTVTAEVVYTDIPSAVLHELFPAQEWMDAIRMPLSGWANIVSDFNTNINTLDFMSEAGSGTVEYPSEFESPLQLKRIRVEGKLADKLSTLTVSKGLLDFGNFIINFNGVVHKQADDYALDGHADTANVSISNIHHYWPKSLSSHTREWVTTHITKGVMGKASVDVHFKPGDLKLKDTPDPDISASIEVRDATVKYKPDHPAISDVSGVVKFTGNTMDVKVTQADDLTDTHSSSATLRAPDLNAPDVRMYLDVNLTAPARDIVTFLALPDINQARKLNLKDSISGNVSGSAKVDFIAFSDNDAKNTSSSGHVNYAVSADLSNVSQSGFMNKYDVENANLNLSLNNKGITTKGKAKVNGLPMALDLTTGFAHGSDTTYTVQLELPVTRFPDFGLPRLDFVKGSMGVDATVLSSDAGDKVDATLNLANTAISLPEHGFVKKEGEKASLALTTQDLASGNTLVKSFTLTGDKMNASGQAELEKGSGDFVSATFDSLHFGKQDLNSLAYSKTPGGIKLVAKGSSLDLAPYIQNTGKNKSSQIEYDVDIKTDHLILGDKRELSNASVVADCAGICRSASINAKLPSGTAFVYNVSNGKLESTCDNTGELLDVLGVSNSIEGGKMTLSGNYASGMLEGQLQIANYKLKNAPILTKIITIASLTGVLDTIRGNGIAFEKLTAPFSYHRNNIMLKEAKAHGAALGITADGTIDLNSSKLDLHGTLVPSYTLNSMVGNIPLIGDALVGGKGKGLIAINYSVKGDMNDPSISINPLSAFTPGFMRGVFDIFDKPAPDLKKLEAEQKKEEEKEKKEALPAASPVPAKPTTNNVPAASAPAIPAPVPVVSPISPMAP